jgi:HAD superfamily hydrolase (TIGR01509 family)
VSRPTVLVDVDGTLVDTNYLHTLAWHRALRGAGVVVPMVRLHRLIGMGSDQMLDELLGKPRPDIEDAWKRHFDELFDDVVAFDGAAGLLRALHERGAEVVLATSGPPDFVARLRDRIGGDEWVDAEVNSSEVEASKPAPDIIGVALERVGGDPERAMVVGDTVWDVKAATASGLRTVCVATGGIDRSELEAAGAVAVYADVAALTEQLTSSPLGPLLAPRSR